MAKRFTTILMAGAFAVTILSGCYTTGKATGEAAQKVDTGAQQFKRGYEQGKNY